jgi:hypothetical protein
VLTGRGTVQRSLLNERNMTCLVRTDLSAAVDYILQQEKQLG